MADYDYKAGKQRLEEILDNDMEIVEQDKLPMMMILHSQMATIVG